MRKRNLPVILALFVVFSVSCKKEKTAVNTPVPPPAADSYLPVTAGSHWDYYAVAGETKDTISVKMTGGTAMINGTDFFTANEISFFDNVIPLNFFTANHLYIERFNAGGGIYQTSTDIVLLNDTVPAGQSFTAAITNIGGANNQPEQEINTVVEKNVTMVVGGQTFSNVIHIRVALQFNAGSGFSTNPVNNYYFAKGVGIIYQDIETPNGVVTESETLVDYSIN